MGHKDDIQAKEFSGVEFRVQLLRHGIRATEVARRLGVSPSYLSHICAGRRKASFRLVRIHRGEPPIIEHLIKIYRDMQSGKFKRLEDY